MTDTEEVPSLRAETRTGGEGHWSRDGPVQGPGLHGQHAGAARTGAAGPPWADTEGF